MPKKAQNPDEDSGDDVPEREGIVTKNPKLEQVEAEIKETQGVLLKTMYDIQAC